VNLTQLIKEQAYRMGFSLVSVTSCDPLQHGDVFEAWLDLGRQGEMAYMGPQRSRQCRANPNLLLPGCRSVLVLGTRYPAPSHIDAKAQSKSSRQRKIASYAWGEDYHVFLPRRLKSLVSFIEAQVGHPIPHRWYTDTGPLLERELAQRAGLGWIGKNTCLINPDEGSYFLLAEVLLGVELESGQPFTADRCGTCTRCIQACPTGCILPDRTLDARRCISYLTIELKGSIPLELRPLMGSWVFGCDACQQVCPWNRFASSQVDPAFAHNLSGQDLDLAEELKLSADDFKQKYRHSPIRRAKRGGYLRNVAVALGNLGEQMAVPALSQALRHDPEALVRAHVAWALGQIGDRYSKMALEKAKADENDVHVLLEIENSLEKYI
jgi:epoxyqueuosine reductase